MEENDSLDVIAGDAQLIDTSPDPRAEQREQQQAQEEAHVFESTAGELLAAATMIRAMWLPLIAATSPRKADALAGVWNDGVLRQAAGAGAQVMQLHGITLGSVLGKFGPYVALVAALAPPVMQTAQIMRVQEAKPAEVVQPPAGEGVDSGQAG